VPPYDYNGFVAYLEFVDMNAEQPHTETSVKASRTTEAGIFVNSKSAAACEYIFSSISLSRSGDILRRFSLCCTRTDGVFFYASCSKRECVFLRADNEENSVPRKLPNSGCDFVFYGNSTRSGHFDTRSTSGWPHDKGPAVCRLTFVGRKVDVVHVSLFNYDLRSVACNRDVHRLH
jgi:hypothetical protein